MIDYILIGISFVLLGVAGLQFFYLAYVQRVLREYKTKIVQLEKRCKSLSNRVEEIEARLAIIEDAFESNGDDDFDEEVWAEIIETD